MSNNSPPKSNPPRTPFITPPPPPARQSAASSDTLNPNQGLGQNQNNNNPPLTQYYQLGAGAYNGQQSLANNNNQPTLQQMQQHLQNLTAQITALQQQNQMLTQNQFIQNNMAQRNQFTNINNRAQYTDATTNNVFLNLTTTIEKPTSTDPMSFDTAGKEDQLRAERDKRFEDAVMRFSDKNLPSTLLSPEDFVDISAYIDYIKSKSIAIFAPIAHGYCPETIQQSIVEHVIAKSLHHQRDRLMNTGWIDRNVISSWTLKNLVSAILSIANKDILQQDSKMKEWKIIRRISGELFEDCYHRIVACAHRVGFRLFDNPAMPMTSFEISQVFNTLFTKLVLSELSRNELFKLAARDGTTWPTVAHFLEECRRLDLTYMSKFVQSTYNLGESATGVTTQTEQDNAIKNAKYINNRPRQMVEGRSQKAIEVNNVNANGGKNNDVNKNRKCFVCGQWGHISVDCSMKKPAETVNSVENEIDNPTDASIDNQVDNFAGNDDNMTDLNVMLNALNFNDTDQLLQNQAASSTDNINDIFNLATGNNNNKSISENGKGNSMNDNANQYNPLLRPAWSKSPGLRFKFTKPKAKAKGKNGKTVNIRFTEEGAIADYEIVAESDNNQTEDVQASEDGSVMVKMLQEELELNGLGEF